MVEKEEETKEEIEEKKKKKRNTIGYIIVVGIIFAIAFGLTITFFPILPTQNENITINSSCLREKVFLFATTSCFPCVEQIDLLEKANISIFIMYCDEPIESRQGKTMIEICREYNITKVPSWWVYNITNKTDYGYLIEHELTLKELKEVSGC